MRQWLFAAIVLGVSSWALAQANPPAAFRSIQLGGEMEALAWTDACNVYILRDGDAALLIDLGDGSVLDHLKDIGVKNVEWVLFTHHHREQCQGHPRLRRTSAKLAGPEAEKALFEKPEGFRKIKPKLGDQYTVHGSSFVRPPVEGLTLDRTFRKTDTFTWRGREFWCIDTRGNSPGGMSYLLKAGDRWVAFSGDVMVDGARMHNWFDTEWDYGFAAGLYALIGSVSYLRTFDASHLLPSHGPAIVEPSKQLDECEAKLRRFAKLYIRGYALNTFAAADQDRVSRPSDIPHVWRITPHLYKMKAPDSWPNFSLLVADSGRALAFDAGLSDRNAVDEALAQMRQKIGLKSIDAVLITHMHGDHFLDVPHLQKSWNAEAWTLDRVADPCMFPQRFDYPAAGWAYGAGFDGLKIDRRFKPGESFDWEGYRFTVDWMPGQTEFGCCINGVIDGKRVAFTGDNLFANPADPTQNGHEALVARNSAILEEGYIYAAEYLKKLQPDLIVGGHAWVMDKPAALIERYHAWAVSARDAYRELLSGDEYRYGFDPYWVRADPYRVIVAPGGSAEVTVLVRNFRTRPQKHRIALHVPAGVKVEPAVLEGEVPAESAHPQTVKLTVDKSAALGTRIIAFDITRDGERLGEWFDMILHVDADRGKLSP